MNAKLYKSNSEYIKVRDHKSKNKQEIKRGFNRAQRRSQDLFAETNPRVIRIVSHHKAAYIYWIGRYKGKLLID